MGIMNSTGVLLSLCCLVPCARAFFAAPPSLGLPPASPNTHGLKHCVPHPVKPRYTTRLAAAEVEADIPGVADTRLAGWRTGKAADMSEEQHGTSDVVGAGADLEPVCGDVVEYPLADRVKEEAADGREKGVGVIVSINKNRNDAWKLPDDILDLAEIEVLCPDLDAEEQGVWMPDELEACAFARVGDMKVLKSSFNGALDKWKRWTINDELSEGCGARDAEWEYDML